MLWFGHRLVAMEVLRGDPESCLKAAGTAFSVITDKRNMWQTGGNHRALSKLSVARRANSHVSGDSHPPRQTHMTSKI